MIGSFTLVCLDMAGTTVRDDGAVEAAFATALGAIGIAPGTPRDAEAQSFVRETMGWSKADVFAGLLDPDDAARATAAFAAAYEAIVAAGDVGEIPGALAVMRTLRARGVRVCLTTGFAPSTRDALLRALGWEGEIDLALSPAAVGRGGKHGVDRQRAAGGHPPGPALVVRHRRLLGVPAVDEHQAQRRAPEPGHIGRTAHHDHHVIFESGCGQRGPQRRQRVQAAGPRVDQSGIVVLPAGLVLLRAAVMVDCDHQLAGRPGRRGQVDRGLAAVAADLEHRPAAGVGGGRREQRLTLGRGHEPGGRLSRAPQLSLEHQLSTHSLHPLPPSGTKVGQHRQHAAVVVVGRRQVQPGEDARRVLADRFFCD